MLQNPDSKVHVAHMGPPGSCRPQLGPMLAPWTLLSGKGMCAKGKYVRREEVIPSQRILWCLITNPYVIYLFFCASALYSYYQQNYCDVIMGAMASQITSLTIVYSTVYWGANQRKHQSSASLAFVRRWPVNSPHKWPVTWKIFQFDDVIMDHHKSNMLNYL